MNGNLNKNSPARAGEDHLKNIYEHRPKIFSPINYESNRNPNITNTFFSMNQNLFSKL